MKKLYRIYTEDKDRQGIIELASTHFKGFTVCPAYGYWEGIPESSIIIEIQVDGTDIERNQVYKLAQDIKVQNKQQAVLVIEIECTGSLV